jgi:hypothetical protein
MSDSDYPRAFVSFPRIAGSGNEIADARAFSARASQHEGPGARLENADIFEWIVFAPTVLNGRFYQACVVFSRLDVKTFCL